MPPGATTVLFNDSDSDSGQTLTVTTTPTTAPTNGSVILSANGTFSYTHNGSETLADSFVYEVCDNGSPVRCDTATVTIAIAPGNDAPALDLDADDSAGANGVNYALSFTEGAGAVTLSNGIGITDPDDTNLETAAVTLTNPQDGTAEVLSINSGLATGFGITATVAVSGDSIGLSGAATLDQYRQVLETVQYNHTSNNPTVAPARTITFTVNDGTVDSAVATATVTLNSINSAPSFTVGPDPTVDEDAGAQTVNSWATAISDGDGGSQTLTFNVTNNTNPSLFSAGPAVSPTGELTYTLAANQNGSATITLTLSDDGSNTPPNVNTSASQSFIITVNAVNDAPSYTKGLDQTVLEDEGAQTVNPWATGLSAGPADESSQTLTFNVTNNTNPSLFSAGPAISPTGVLTYTPTANTNGSATITLTLSDNGSNVAPNVNTSAAQTFVITVTAVNDAPSFTAGANQTANEDAGAQTVNPWATTLDDGDSEVSQTLTFNVTNNTNPSLFSAVPAVSATGVLTYTPAANQNGNATITLTLSDNGSNVAPNVNTSAAQTFTITVNAVNDAPVAQAKSYTAHTHMKMVGLSGLLSGVTDADSGVNGCAPMFTVASVNSADGTVSNVSAAAGTFDFDPNPGFTGPATATYTVQDTGCPGAATSAPATISITVSGPVIWFVQQGASGTNDGRLSNPFTSLGSVPAVDSANDRVFVFTGTYTNGLALLSGEQLIGQGVTGTTFDNFFGITPPAGTIARPTINGTRPTLQNTVTLSTNGIVRGLNITTTNSTALADPAGATTGVTVNEVDVSAATATAVSFNDLTGTVTLGSTTSTGGTNNVSLTSVAATVNLGSGALSGASAGASNHAFLVSGGAGNVTYTGSITKANQGNVVNISGRTGGTITLSGVINGNSSNGINVSNNTSGAPVINFTDTSTSLNTGANPAVTLDNNDNATINFSGGGLAITTTSGVGFNAINGATAINVTSSNNTITSSSATALNVVSSTIGALGLNFQSISSGNNTAAADPANGIVLNNTGALNGLTVAGTGTAGSGGTIQNSTDNGIKATNVTGLTLSSLNVTNNGDSTVDHADEGIDLQNLLGTASITNTSVTGSKHHNLFLDNTSGTLASLTITGSTFNSAIGGDGILFRAIGTAAVTSVIIGGSTFSDNQVTGMHVISEDTATVSDFTVSGNTFTDANAGDGLSQEIGMDFNTNDTGNLTFKVLNNLTITGHNSHAMNIATGAGAGTGGTLNGRITGNIIGNAGVASSGSAIGNGIRVNGNGDAIKNILLDGNTIRQTPNGRGIEAINRNGTGRMDITVTNNDANPQDTSGFPLHAILVQSNCVTVCNTVRSDVRGNTVSAPSDVTDLLTTYIGLVETGASTLQLVDTAPASANCTAQLTSTNTGSASANAGCALIAGPINTPP